MSNAIETAVAAAKQRVVPRGRSFANQTFQYETVRNAGYILANCADLGEILEAVELIDEGDTESW